MYCSANARKCRSCRAVHNVNCTYSNTVQNRLSTLLTMYKGPLGLFSQPCLCSEASCGYFPVGRSFDASATNQAVNELALSLCGSLPCVLTVCETRISGPRKVYTSVLDHESCVQMKIPLSL